MKIINDCKRNKDSNDPQQRKALKLYYDDKIRKSGMLEKIILFCKKHYALWQLSLDYNVYEKPCLLVE